MHKFTVMTWNVESPFRPTETSAGTASVYRAKLQLIASAVLQLAPDGSQPGSRGFDLPDPGDRNRLFNLSNFIPAERRFSRTTNGERELLDQIFVSEEWLPSHDGLRARPSANAYPEIVEGTHSITADPHQRSEQCVPDHAPVAATFDLALFKATADH